MPLGKGNGRGGARPGAGRKPKLKPDVAPKVAAPAAAETAAPKKVEPAIDITAIAQKAALKGVKRLEGIIRDGSAADAIKATKELLLWGFVKPEMAKAGAAADRYQAQPQPAVEKPAEPAKDDRGVKEIRRDNAEKATSEGTFAVPSPPRLVHSS